ncbi:sugar isomerase domain-containing protein [Aggregatilinea lenta]|uniref:sugar isomerase domain-containing protein n=1 Tax=Aggregatilinea lenta TaxID=913108 RepID=UPI000E5B63AB|nr:SIS domain-containing protein [Aggregatilinea lenta]
MTSKLASQRYIDSAKAIVDQIYTTQIDNIEAAAEICSETIVKDGLVFCWGGGHSRMSVEEMFPRIGSFPGFFPMVELALTFYTNVVGPDGLPQSFFIERAEGYADAILSTYEFGPHDSMLCFSSTGINGVVIDMALRAKERGMPVIAVTSVAHADSTPTRHSSGKKLKDIADVVIDNCTPPGDAVVQVEGLKYKVGPTSTIAAVTVVNALKARTAELMMAKGVEPVVLTSPHFVDNQAESDTQLKRVYDEFKRRKRMIYGRD